jgi:hypothetical protein
MTITRQRSAAAWVQAMTLAAENAEAPPSKHFDLELNDYIDDNCDEGYH